MRFFGRRTGDNAALSLLDRVELGAPTVRGTLRIVPIRLAEPSPVSREYDPLDDALRGGWATVTEVSTSGAVPRLAIQNRGDRAVFLLDGEELVGAKQNRVLNLSILVPARATVPIPVSCVERGRWSYRTATFGTSPQTVFGELRMQQQMAVTGCYLAHGTPDSDQDLVWNSIERRMHKLGAQSPTDSMYDAFEAKRAALDDMIADLAPEARDIGAVFTIGGHVMGMELFEFPDMFAAYFHKIARGYALDALVKREPKDFAMREVADFVADVRRARSRRFRAVGMGRDVRLDDAAVAGGALILDERLVHLAAFRATTR